ncbi:pectate lyase [Dickeya dianthicola]|nr:pectate lyase [Dickeya dianthicola]MCI4191056.1 pectate lyase [Dickeya dianthicola]MCI4203677.1 pectate lyase [Dickeya dianthicola]MCI4208774.1 pectate lyase [Dickeya dianthicola]MCI4223980.1 pectate lyase [Dickeya dianthicola]MCI4238241.1 pectate lyase [Dickeya dianthicola]
MMRKTAMPKSTVMPAIDTAFSRRYLLKLAVLLPVFPYARTAQADSGVTGYAKIKQVSGGGVGGETVYVNNVKALAFHLGGPAHKNIIITCTLKAPDKYTILLGSNKTLIGQRPGVTLYNIYLVSSHNQGNVIIKNMTFLHDKKINGNNDIQLRISSGDGYWLDHCNFMGHEWSVNDGAEDKHIYFGENADFITISNCVFANHRYGCIFGYPVDGNSKFKGKPRITICNNYYHNLYVRAPGLFRYGNFIVFENVIREFHLGFTVDGDARVYSSNNHFYSTFKNFSVVDYKQGYLHSQNDNVNGQIINKIWGR